MPKQFTRTKEDFICGHCGHAVKGNGYTNHCPICLWSKHVDVNPGDREAVCGGMMKPVGIKKAGDEVDILHRCIQCRHEHWNKAAPHDNKDVLFELPAR